VWALTLEWALEFPSDAGWACNTQPAFEAEWQLKRCLFPSFRKKQIPTR
jgi:hypothetical protein